MQPSASGCDPLPILLIFVFDQNLNQNRDVVAPTAVTHNASEWRRGDVDVVLPAWEVKSFWRRGMSEKCGRVRGKIHDSHYSFSTKLELRRGVEPTTLPFLDLHFSWK